jgi:hypothetical protein
MDELQNYAGEVLRAQIIELLSAESAKCKEHLTYYKIDDDHLPLAGEMMKMHEGTILWAEKIKEIIKNIKIE